MLLATMWAPSEGYERLKPFLHCLDEALGVDGDAPGLGGATLLQRGTYAEANALLAAGGADIGLVCTSSASVESLRGRFDVPFKLRFADGGGTYSSGIVVRADDPATTLADLEGASIAWVDPDSLTGYRLPRSYLRSQGVDPDGFFGESTMAHSHDRAAKAVRDGTVRVAAVDEQILDVLGLGDELRLIWHSDPYPSPPLLVARAHPELRDALERISQRPECLAGFGAVGLEPASWSDYGDVGAIMERGK